MNRLLRGKCLAWLALLCLGCAPAAEVVDDTPPPTRVSTDFARLPELLEGITGSGQVVLYEGLPSPFWEPQLRDQELNSADTRLVQGHRVYDTPQDPSAADGPKLTEILSSSQSYAPLVSGSPKTCGEFNVEFCIEFTHGSKITQVLICLECGEVLLFGPAGELHCRLSPESLKLLPPLLKPYEQGEKGENPYSKN
ncbi:MAG: hypothetical protein JSS02_00140 [Planctomycetes bacterium]|nr:hypothetical protein [Planctomycetota bacterium]